MLGCLTRCSHSRKQLVTGLTRSLPAYQGLLEDPQASFSQAYGLVSQQICSQSQNDSHSCLHGLSMDSRQLSFASGPALQWEPGRPFEPGSRANFASTARKQEGQYESDSQAAKDPQAPSRNNSLPVDPLWNVPNGISMARLVSGPIIGYLILDEQWAWAMSSLAISGISDWLDGFVARKFNQSSVIGSYLDPLADKVLICCTTGALAMQGSLYAPLAYLIIGRDVFLVSGAFALRFRALNWKWPGFWEFFRTIPAESSQIVESAEVGQETQQGGRNTGKSNTEDKDSSSSEPAPFVTPLYISKVNTVVQLSLIGGCITSSWYGWPSESVLLALGGLTGLLTVSSGYEYYRQRRKK